MTLAVVFPGQGSQHQGMLSDLYQADQNTQLVFNQASEIVGYDLRNLIDQQTDKLNQTEFTQVALFVSSFALWQKIKDKVKPKAFAGHSLGEYNALLAADVLSFEDALALVEKRAQLMAKSAVQGGSMAAVLGLNAQKIVDICSQFDAKVTAANFNAEDQTVIAGEDDAVKRCSEKLRENGAKRVIALSVSVASHCYLMKPASIELAKYMENISFKTPQIPVIHNVDCLSHQDGQSIKKALTRQLYQSVQWHQTMNKFVNDIGINELIECGPSRVLTNLAKKTKAFQSVQSIHGLDSLNTLN